MAEESVAQDQIRAFIERIEKLNEEKAAVSEDIKEVFAEAKGNGFSPKILREIIKIRKMDANERMEQEALLDLYMSALGMMAAHQRIDMNSKELEQIYKYYLPRYRDLVAALKEITDCYGDFNKPIDIDWYHNPIIVDVRGVRVGVAKNDNFNRIAFAVKQSLESELFEIKKVLINLGFNPDE